ncbi:MAG TPA: hypothetical protein VHF89_12035 [Solirubrobacteraceae bacterium]|nr:hypothetical protein [Solirubrobacteraceae bacterium]
MTTNRHEPLRGEAAFDAAKRLVAERNEIAYARGRAARAASHAAFFDRRRAAERQEAAELPTQPMQR